MYKACKIQQSADRQWQIAQSMIDLMRTQSYHDITIALLCRKANIPRKAFYRYFDRIDDVFQLLIDHMFLEYTAFTISFSTEKTGSPLWNMEKFFSFWKQKEEWLDALDNNKMFGLMVSRIIENCQNGSLDIHLEQTDIPKKEMTAVSAYVISGLFAMVQIWYLQGFSPSIQEIASLAVRLLAQPLYHSEKQN